MLTPFALINPLVVPLPPAMVIPLVDCNMTDVEAALVDVRVPLFVNVSPFTFIVITLFVETVVFAAIVVLKLTGVVVTVPLPALSSIVVADPPSD